MAYDRYESRRDWREARPRWQRRRPRPSAGDRGFDRDRDRDERGWFERAGDEIASWFGDEEAERRRRQRPATAFRPTAQRASSAATEPRPRPARDFRRDRRLHERRGLRPLRAQPALARRGYRRPYTGRSAGRQDFGPDRGERPNRPMAGDYGRGVRGPAWSAAAPSTGSAPHHDRHYGEWRQRQIDELDRDYDEYRRENRSRFEDDFAQLARAPRRASASCSARSASRWRWSAATMSMSAPSTASPATA